MSDSATSNTVSAHSDQRTDVRVFSRRLAFVVLAAFIMISPAMTQVFGIKSVFIRPWIMFSAVGIGLLKGEFVQHAADGTITRYEPTEVLGRTQYSRALSTAHDYHVFRDADLSRVVAPFCATLSEGARLSFDGYRQARQGWVRLVSDNVCEAA